jgi:hypothetical protein
MSLPLPVSSRALRRRTVNTPERPLRQAAILPLFGPEGTVHRLMILNHQSSDLFLIDRADVRPRIPLWRPVGLEFGPGALQPWDELQPSTMAELWYFDPWGLVADARYDFVTSIAALREANSFGQFSEEITSLYYRRDLSRVMLVMQRTKNGSQLRRFPANVLPSRVTVTPAPSHRTWRLAPFWRE